MPLRAIALNCTLKPASKGEPSSTDVLLGQVATALEALGVQTETIRVVDAGVKPGVSSDEGEGDGWPAIRQRILDARILIIGTPIWLGQPSSICKCVLERMDAFLSEQDEGGRIVATGRVAALAVVGNEDGAHHVTAEVFQALNDVGFTLPANAVAYWVGEAMGDKDYKDLPSTPDKVQSSIDLLARNTAHLAAVLAEHTFPASK